MRRFGYYWKEGLRNIFKHGFMSIAAIAIMVACLILTGTVTLIAYNIDLSIVDLQQSNEIVVWIDENLTTREAKDLQPQFEKIGNIGTGSSGGSAEDELRLTSFNLALTGDVNGDQSHK